MEASDIDAEDVTASAYHHRPDCQAAPIWDKHAPRYDRQMQFLDRKLFGDTRAWICRQATGRVLEVAVGTGLNLEFYPAEVRLTGVDFSPAMLAQVRDRARQLGRTVELLGR